MRESIALAFEGLSPRLRVVATLALIEEQPYAEIADALDVPIGTVKSRSPVPSKACGPSSPDWVSDHER